MLKYILKRKVPIKIVRVKLQKDVRHFSAWQLLVFVLVFAGIGSYIIYHSFASPPCSITTCSGGQSAPAYNPTNTGSFYAVNYTQAAHDGPDMWTNYNPTLVRADFAKIREFGFNGVRTTIPAYNGAFDWPSPTAGQLANLEDFYRAAKANGIQLHLAMFDLFGGRIGYIGQSRTWATAVINSLKTVDPKLGGIYALETHNEMFTGASYNTTYRGGFDSGWPASVAKPTNTWAVELMWVRFMTYTFRALAPGIPVTTSVPSAQVRPLTNPIEPGEGLGFYYHYSYGTDWQPTWYDYHCYGGPNYIKAQLSTALSVVGGDPKMLHIGEFGYNVNGSNIAPAQRTAAAKYAQNVRYYAHQLGLPEPQWWMLYDIAAGGTQFPSGQSDGLLTVSGLDTAAGTVFRTYPPGTVPPLAQ